MLIQPHAKRHTRHSAQRDLALRPAPACNSAEDPWYSGIPSNTVSVRSRQYTRASDDGAGKVGRSRFPEPLYNLVETHRRHPPLGRCLPSSSNGCVSVFFQVMLSKSTPVKMHDQLRFPSEEVHFPGSSYHICGPSLLSASYLADFYLNQHRQGLSHAC